VKKLNKREEKFYFNWDKRRKNKWLYVFLHGSVYWGLPFALVLFLWISYLQMSKMEIPKLLTYIGLFGVTGIVNGVIVFNRNEKKFFKLLYRKEFDNEIIVTGVQLLKTGNQWSYENIKIQNDSDKSLLIQNEQDWFDEKDPSPRILEECFQSMHHEYQRLQKNKDFEDYTKNRKAKIQIVGNSNESVPLLEKVI
jgi:hydroxymethylpyrimidine pyrophosphatase-like HAD family hydrolase